MLQFLQSALDWAEVWALLLPLALLFFKRAAFKKPYRLALAFLLAVILTGLFGAIVVKLNLAHASISVHLLFAIILIQLQLAIILSVKSAGLPR